MSCKIRSFCKFFMHIFSGKNVFPPKLTELLRLWKLDDHSTNTLYYSRPWAMFGKHRSYNTKLECKPSPGHQLNKFNHVTMRFANRHMPFLLVVHWSRVSIFNCFRDIRPKNITAFLLIFCFGHGRLVSFWAYVSL